ncbi:MAG: DegV family protein [Coprococcus sp.]|nr:DegV family protein [Coprococcus sp.]
MNKIQIMTDSARDISYVDEEKYSIKVIPFSGAFWDRSYTSRVDFDNEQFFELMA